MITIKDCILNYIESERMDIVKIKITNFYSFAGSNFEISLTDGTTKNIYIEIQNNEDESLVEFYNQSNELIARAKGFTSVI
jgi:hypothetical protein